MAFNFFSSKTSRSKYSRFDELIKNKDLPIMGELPMKSHPSTNSKPSLPFYVRIMRSITDDPSTSDSSHSAHQKTAQWKIIYNEDRFFHSSLEVSAKVSHDEVTTYIAEEEKESKKKEKQKELDKSGVKEDVAGGTLDRESSSMMSDTSQNSSLLSLNQYSSGKNDLEEKKGTDPDDKVDDPGEYQKIDKTLNDKAVNTSQSGDYSYFKPNKEKGKKAGRRIAFFDGKLKRVSQIDTCAETFHCVFHYYLTWLMSKEEVTRMKAAEKNEELNEEWKPKSYPRFECMNKVDGEMNQVGKFKIKEGNSFKALKGQIPEREFPNHWGKSFFDIHRDDLGFDPINAYWCRVQYECKFQCAEEMELEMFPFDCQDLGVYMRLKQKADKWDVLPLPRHGEIFNVDARFSMISEWMIPGVMLEFDQGDPSLAKNGIGYNSAIIRIKAERKWQSHITDSFTIFCMFWLGLATFGMPVEEVGDRLAYCITLLLTDVATMQLLNASVPNIPYRTFLDTYTLSCFGFLVMITVWVTISGWDGHAPLGRASDNMAFYVFCVFAIVMHVIFYIRMCLGHKNEKSKMVMDSEGLDDYFKAMAHFASSSSMPQVGVYWDSRSIRLNRDSKIDRKRTCIKKKRWTCLSYPWHDHIAGVEDPFSKVKPDKNLGRA